MPSITQFQKKYPDTIKAEVKTNSGMSLKEVRSLANLIHGPESTILQGTVTRKKTIVYVSKIAFSEGVKDESPIFKS